MKDLKYLDVPMFVTLGGVRFQIIVDSPEDDEQTDGCIDESKSKIVIKPGLDDGYMKRVLLHEIVHLFHFTRGIGGDTEKETDMLATAIYDFMIQNPEIVSWIIKEVN